MILLLILLFLFRQYRTSAAPIVASFPEPSVYKATTSIRDDSTDASSGRSILEIVWSCLATTFAVTWVSVHPNVPRLEESSLHLLKRRIFLMCLALLAPEVMIMWAFKQWRGAVIIKDTINNARAKSGLTQWTMTHAHFLQMGGFKVNHQENMNFWTCRYYTYSTTKKGLKVQECSLNFDNFQTLLNKKVIDFPETTAKEIEDRRKSNALSKGVALLQICWFLMQLIARTLQQLDITQMELTTATLAGLNSVMYLFWWNKPFDVRCPIIIYSKALQRQLVEAQNTDQAQWTLPNRVDFDLTSRAMTTAGSYLVWILNKPRKTLGWVLRSLISFPCKFWDTIRASMASNGNTGKPAFCQSLKLIWTCYKSAISTLIYLPYLLMFMPVYAILDPLLVTGLYPFSDAKERMDKSTSLKLLLDKSDMRWIMSMMFYSEDADMKPLLFFSALGGAAFGSIHCAAWNFDFPSTVEQVLWRTASLTIVGVCLSIILGIPLYNCIVRLWRTNFSESYKLYIVDQRLPVSDQKGVKHYLKDANVRMWSLVRRTLQTIPAIIYPLARVSLLALALSSLRDLRGSALETVTWTKFIPHI